MAGRKSYITARRCAEGTLYLDHHDTCPTCGSALAPVRIPSTATLVTHTVVRVNPSGEPFRLGVAVATGGAATLCIIEGDIRGNGRDRVTLVLRDGRYHALAARSRLNGRSPAPPSTAEDSQKS